MKIRIDVTNDVIQQAEAWRDGGQERGKISEQCVVSQAVKEHVRDDVEVNSARDFVCFNWYHNAEHPLIERLVADFDAKRRITPTSFEIEIPEQYLNEYAKAEFGLPEPTQVQKVGRTEVLANAK